MSKNNEGYQHHKLKLEEQFVQPILNGEKTFEVRLNDRKFKVGDTIEFMPIAHWDNTIIFKWIPEITSKTYEITFVLEGWGIKEGYCVFSFKELKK
ncbi:MAG: DUF3850 domain-containing protein [Ruminococcus sp.]|nr:DUF3850 domain-containing protein [Ruminococcus sp.]